MSMSEPGIPADLHVRLKRASTLVEQGDWKAAAQIYADVMTQHPRAAEAYYGMGLIALLHRRDLSLAEKAFTAAAKENPEDANSLYRLGEIAEAQHNRETAIDFYRRALAVLPRHEAAQRRLAALNKGASAQPPPEAATPRKPVLGPPRAPQYQDSYVGVVRDLQTHEKGALSSQALTFKLAFPYRLDGAYREVRLAGSGGDVLRGAVKNGQWVELHRSAKVKNGQLRVAEMLNLDSGKPVFATMGAVKRRGVYKAAAPQVGMAARVMVAPGNRGRRVRFSERRKPSPLLTDKERERLAAQLLAAGGSGSASSHAVATAPSRSEAAQVPAAPRRTRETGPARTIPQTDGARRERLRVPIVVGALALAAVAVVAAIALLTRSSTSPTSGPTTSSPPPPPVSDGVGASVETYWSAINGGNYLAAFRQLDASEQNLVGGQQKFVDDHNADAPIRVEGRLGRALVSGVAATVPVISLETVGSHSGCARWTGSYEMRRIGSLWLIDRVNITRRSC